MTVYFCSDLHFGHKNIQKFRSFVKDEEDNRNQIINCWNQLVTKRDDVYVLGDSVFTTETLPYLKGLPGRKFLVRGNHDCLDTSMYLKTFSQVYGLLKYKEFWLSHAPIHPNELRGKINLHGHVHYATIDDPRYVNCCVESLRSIFNRPIASLDEIRNLLKIRNEAGIR